MCLVRFSSPTSCERPPAEGSSPFSQGRLSLGELQPDTGVLLLLGEESLEKRGMGVSLGSQSHFSSLSVSSSPSVSGTLCLTVGGALSLRVSGLLRVFRCFFSLFFTFRLGSDAGKKEFWTYSSVHLMTFLTLRSISLEFLQHHSELVITENTRKVTQV